MPSEIRTASAWDIIILEMHKKIKHLGAAKSHFMSFVRRFSKFCTPYRNLFLPLVNEFHRCKSLPLFPKVAKRAFLFGYNTTFFALKPKCKPALLLQKYFCRKSHSFYFDHSVFFFYGQLFCGSHRGRSDSKSLTISVYLFDSNLSKNVVLSFKFYHFRRKKNKCKNWAKTASFFLYFFRPIRRTVWRSGCCSTSPAGTKRLAAP